MAKEIKNPRRPMTASAIVKANGLSLWERGGGNQAYALHLKDAVMSDGSRANLDLLIAADDGDHVAAKPTEKVWSAAVCYEDDTRFETAVFSGADLTLEEAIAEGLELARDVDEIWGLYFGSNDSTRLQP